MNEPTGTPQGLLNAQLLNGSGGARSLEWAEVVRWEAGDGLLWLHFDLDEPGTHQWVAEQSGLSEVASSALLSEETRPRTVHRDERLLLVLRGVNPSISAEADDMISVRIWSDGQRVISTRYRGLESTDNLIASLRDGDGPRNVQELLDVWIGGIIERLKATVDRFEDAVMALDERVLAGDTDGVRSDLSRVRKQLISVRRYLTPMREALSKLGTASVPWIDDDHRLMIRETADQLIRNIEDLDEVRDRAILCQEELLTQVSESMNTRSYVFTVVATIFLPLGFLTGLFGINVGGMPGVENDGAFWLVVWSCVALTAGLGLLFRMSRWL